MDKVIRFHTLVYVIERSVVHEAELHIAGGAEQTAVRRRHRRNGTCPSACLMTDQCYIARLFEHTGNEVGTGEAGL